MSKNLYDVDVYVGFRVPVAAVEAGPPEEAAQLARDQVIEVLSEAEEINHAGLLLYFEEAANQGVDVFATGDEQGDTDTVYFGRRADLDKQAKEHATTLLGLITEHQATESFPSQLELQQLNNIRLFLLNLWCIT